jgi:hypothetical protein
MSCKQSITSRCKRSARVKFQAAKASALARWSALVLVLVEVYPLLIDLLPTLQASEMPESYRNIVRVVAVIGIVSKAFGGKSAAGKDGGENG